MRNQPSATSRKTIEMRDGRLHEFEASVGRLLHASFMAYDRLAESIRLINGGPVAGAEALSRRRRVLPVAVDVDGDIAVTVFLRRAHGGAEWEEHVLTGGESRWFLLGGGSCGLEQLDVLTRPAPVDDGHFIQEDGGGGVAAGNDWIQHAQLCTDPAVDRVLVDHGRVIRTPRHGRVAIVWRGNRPISVTASDRSSSDIARSPSTSTSGLTETVSSASTDGTARPPKSHAEVAVLGV